MYKLYKEIREKVLVYYNQNTPGHRWHHAVDVTNIALAMNERLNLCIRKKDIVAAALLHDVMEFKGRKEHHKEAMAWLGIGDAENWFNDLCIDHKLSFVGILLAVYEHRASYNGFYSSPLSELISSADRGAPDLERTVGRIKAHQGGIGWEEHLVKKFGVNGYAKFPEIYKRYWGQKFVEFQNRIEELVK